MRGKPKLTLKQKHDLRRLYKDGARDVDLADWFSVSEATVRGHTKDIRRPNPRRTFDYARAKNLADQGISKEEIGRRFGVHGTAIGKALVRLENAA